MLPLLGNVTGPVLLAEIVAAARADGDVAEWRNAHYCTTLDLGLILNRSGVSHAAPALIGWCMHSDGTCDCAVTVLWLCCDRALCCVQRLCAWRGGLSGADRCSKSDAMPV